jgi:hypothetical protein
MKELDPGHCYQLDSLDGNAQNDTIQFVKRKGVNYPGNTTTYPGTTTQDVLRVLIARAKYVNNQISCAETEISISLMRTIILLYEQRAKRIKGQTLNLMSADAIEELKTCTTCGHILCKDHVRG